MQNTNNSTATKNYTLTFTKDTGSLSAKSQVNNCLGKPQLVAWVSTKERK